MNYDMYYDMQMMSFIVVFRIYILYLTFSSFILGNLLYRVNL